MSAYNVRYQRDEGGAWIATVPGVPGCHSYGRTIEQARERIREALGLWVADARTADLVDDVRLPLAMRTSVRRARSARRRAELQQANAQRSLAAAAHELTTRWDVSLRDAGELLGLSRQRIQQLTRKRIGQKRSLLRAKRSR